MTGFTASIERLEAHERYRPFGDLPVALRAGDFLVRPREGEGALFFMIEGDAVPSIRNMAPGAVGLPIGDELGTMGIRMTGLARFYRRARCGGGLPGAGICGVAFHARRFGMLSLEWKSRSGMIESDHLPVSRPVACFAPGFGDGVLEISPVDIGMAGTAADA